MDMEMMMSSSQDSGSAWYHYHSAGHDEATGGGDGGGDADFLEMLIGDLHSSSSGSGDLFELVWQGGGRGHSSLPAMHAGGSLPSSSLPPADQRQPPSEDEMAAWLYAIVSGDAAVESAVVGMDMPTGGDDVGNSAENDQHQLLVAPGKEAAKTEVMKCTEDTVSNCSERGKERGGRRSHHSETHLLTEKRRRWKMNEKFKTLQQMVPGCNNKSNQTSTLEQTIKYMKSLQHQIQAMPFGCEIKPASTMVHPLLPPQPTVTGARPILLPTTVAMEVWPGVVLGPPPLAMEQFGSMLPLLSYSTVVVPPPMLQATVTQMCQHYLHCKSSNLV